MAEGEGAGAHEEPPEDPSEGGAGCRVGEPARLSESPRAVAVAVAFGAQGGGLAAVAEGADSLRLVPLSAEGRPEGAGRVVAIPDAPELFAFVASGPHYIAVTRSRCDGAPCLRGSLLDATGALLGGTPADAALPGEITTIKRAPAAMGLSMAASFAEAPPALVRFAKAPGDDAPPLTAEVRRLGPRDAAGPHEILALAADEGRFAVLHRSGATEDPESIVRLTTAAGSHPAPALHDALAVESFAFAGEDLAAILAFEFDRPTWISLGLDGEVRGTPTPIVFGRTPPSPFNDSRRALLRDDGQTLSLRVETGAGDPVAQDVPIFERTEPGRRIPADVARLGARFVAAYARPGGDDGAVVEAVRVQCDAAAPAELSPSPE